MRKLRKIWKIIGGLGITGALVAVCIFYVAAATDVKISMVNAHVVVNQGSSTTLSVNMTGRDENNPDPNDKPPIPENVEWTSDKINLVDFGDLTKNDALVKGNSATIYGNFAGQSEIKATYYSKRLDAEGNVLSKTAVATATLDATVPLELITIDVNGNENISGVVYKTGDTISITSNTHQDNPLVIETSNQGVVEVASLDYNNATIKAVGGGSTTLTVRTQDGEGNEELVKKYNIKVKVDFTDGYINDIGNRVVSLDPTPYVPFTRTLIKSNVIDPSQSGATWISGDKDIFEAYDNGEVLGKYAGYAKLEAGIQSEDVGGHKNFYTDSSDVIYVVTPFKWLNSVENMNVTDTFKLETTGKPEQLSWNTSDNKVLQVDSDGTVTAIGSGTAVITVSRPVDPQNPNNVYNEVFTLTMKINVIDSFGLSTTSKDIDVGETFVLSALTTSKDANVTFKATRISDEVVNVNKIINIEESEDGKSVTITGVGSGTVKIVATQNLNGLIKTAECIVYVRTPVDEVMINPDRIEIQRGDTGIVQLLFNPSSPYNDKVLWTTSNPEIATVTGDSATATITAIKGGQATISVITMDGLKVASCEVYVKEPVTGLSLNETSVSSTMAVGKFQLVPTILPAGEGVDRSVTWTSSDTSVVTVDSNGLVKFVAPGYATVICKTVDGGYIASCNFFISIPVETIKLDYTDEILSLGQRLRITAEILPLSASNRTVVWTSSNESVCVVDTNGLVQAVGTGHATILCKSLDGNATAMCNIYVKQPATSVVLNTTEMTVRKGAVFWLNATVLPENADNKIIEWSSRDEKIATVDKDGKVTAVSPGMTQIIATNPDTGLMSYCTVTVTQPVTGIKLNSDYQELWVGSKYAIIPYVEPVDAENKNVTYQSSDESVATVDENGVVTAVGGGSCIIIVTTEECKLTATVTIDVKEYVSSIKLSENNKTMHIGTKSKLNATVERSTATNRDVVWSSTNSEVVSVDENGNIYANSVGTAIIVATAADGSGVTDSCIVDVIEPVKSISIEPSSITLMEGQSQMVYARVYPENATIQDVTWVSSNESVATVDEEGEVFAIGAGKCRITAISTDGTEVKGYCSVYVTKYVKISSIKINSKEITMLAGKTRQLTARITPANAVESVSWYSTDTSIVDVDEDGRITTISPGTAEVVCVGGTSNIEGSCTVHVMDISNKSITLEQYDGFDLYVDGATKTVSWRTGNPRIATVSSQGHVVARMAGTTTITATVDGKTMTCFVRVTNIR